MMGDINKMLESRVNTLKLKEAGIDSETIKSLHINISANQETFKGRETSKLGSGIKLIFGGLAGYLLFMFIIIYGNMIMRSVIEEKTSWYQQKDFTTGGVLIRTRVKEIRELGRATQGVTLINLGEGEKLSGIEKIVETDDEEGVA